MDSSHGKKRTNVRGDRLSNLSDDLIYEILSLIGIKQVVETSVLSSRWRYIWTSTPYLNISTEDFCTLPEVSKFVTSFLSSRNDQSEVFSLNLTFQEKVSQEFVQRMLNYAFSHNVQQLNITCLPGQSYLLAEFPPSLFSSQSLKHLSLTGRIDTRSFMLRPIWSLPTLTTMILDNVTFYDDKYAANFSKCVNLKNLTLKNMAYHSFSIRHPELWSLTLEGGGKRINVITPQLKNLTVNNWRGPIHMVAAHNLSSLHYADSYRFYKDDGDCPLKLPTDLPHLENVNICIDSLFVNKAYAHRINYLLQLLQRLYSVKYLTLNLELVKFFASVKLISHQTSPFVNLRSLKIYPANVPLVEQKQPEVTMCSEVKKYFLDGSSGATLTMVSYEEIRAVKNVISARNLMIEVKDKLKILIKTNRTNTEQDKAPSESQVATTYEQVFHLERTASMLLRIDALLKKMPTYHRDTLQERFFSLSAEFQRYL